jgi:hypothetical protein
MLYNNLKKDCFTNYNTNGKFLHSEVLIKQKCFKGGWGQELEFLFSWGDTVSQINGIIYTNTTIMHISANRNYWD